MKYVLNPAYYLKRDGNRVIIGNREYYYGKTPYQECTSYIHPINAQLISFFNGLDDLDQIEHKISCHFNLPLEEVKSILKMYIKNEKSFSIKHKDCWMFFPENLIIEKNDIAETDYYVYNIEDFSYSEEPDLTTMRTELPLNANLLLTMKCYTDCIYCYANRNIKGMMTLDQILSIIDQAKRIGMLRIDINGGEVLLHPHYKEIIQKLIEYDFHPYISTKVPINDDTINILKDIGLKNIQISLDSANPSTLSKMLNVKESYFDLMKNTITSLDKIGMKTIIHTIMTSYNSSIEEMDHLISFISQFSCIQNIRFSPAGYSLYKSDIYQQVKTSSDFMDELEKHIETIKSNYPSLSFNFSSGDLQKDYEIKNRKRSFPKRASCTGNMRNIVILPDGRVTICEELYEHPEFIIGDLTKQSIEEVWNSQKAKDLFFIKQSMIHKESACQQCSSFESCRYDRGVCWKIVLMAYGYENWDFPDPRCPQAPTMFNNICLK